MLNRKLIFVLVILGVLSFIGVGGYFYFRDDSDGIREDITDSIFSEEDNCYEADGYLPVIPGAECCSGTKFEAYEGDLTGIAGYCLRK